MSFAIIHRDVDREWEKTRWNFKGYFFYNKWSYTSGAQILRGMRSSNFISNFIIALEHLLGAYEKWSFRSITSLKDCSIGLLHSCFFLYFHY